MALSSLFRHRAPVMVGVDISAASIRLVELGQDSRGNWRLEHCASEPLGNQWVMDGNIENPGEVSVALRRLLQKSGTRAKHAVLALPYGTVITKRVAMPASLPEQEMEFQVEAEVAQLVPFAMAEVSFDFCVLGPNPRVPTDADVLITATRRERVQERMGLAEAAGLTPRVIDVETFAARAALDRILPAAAAQSMLALVRVSPDGFSLHVMRGDEVLYSSEQELGNGGQLIQMIADQYGISLDEARARKHNADLPADYPESVLRPFVDGLAQDVTQALQFFFNTTSIQGVQQIVLFGDLEDPDGLTAAVQAGTQLNTLAPNPFEGMAISSGVDAARLRREAPAYLTACGLAMRRFAS